MAILCKYTYDPLDRLSTVTPLAQAVANRFYNGEHLMTELQGGRQRTCIRAGGQLLAQQSREGDEVVTMMIASDLHNSVLHASEDGHQADIAYSPYGHHDTAQALDGMPGFNGEQRRPSHRLLPAWQRLSRLQPGADALQQPGQPEPVWQGWRECVRVLRGRSGQPG